MTSYSQFQCPNDTSLGDLPAVFPSAGAGGWQPAGRKVSIGRWIADCVEVLSGYYAAAATYEQLSRLSDAELRRRGLSRDTLARDVCAACESAAARDRQDDPTS
jgi:hypothetical protein